MKRYLISTVAVLVVLVTVLGAFAQQQRTRQGRGRFMGREERVKAVEAIEAQLAKLKAEEDIQRPQGSFQDMSEEERAKFREQMTKVFQERQKTLQAIMGQLYLIQGRRAPEGENVQYVLLSTNDLKPLQESAVKEKAAETGKLVDELIARASGQRRFGGGRQGSGQGGGQGRSRQ